MAQMLGSQLSACPNEKIEITLLNLNNFLTPISRYLEFTPAWNYDSYLIRQGYKSTPKFSWQYIDFATYTSSIKNIWTFI